ncbi:Slx4p interacting protein [Elasticomyces elasticus]|nr:Slx4p interacting protein [Elasticomyces elasticus]
MEKPIPAFYCCYLLRSTVRHACLYVGSTPNPVRRLRQHNGESKGGAVRTSKDSLRPWEMTCIVAGFPSKIAALQFEWAWQNTHLTRHIAPDDRITQPQTRTRISPRSGKTRKRIARPRFSLTDRLSNLHLLLRSSSFERWPLEVRFFAQDVYRAWLRWDKGMFFKVRKGIKVGLDGVDFTTSSAELPDVTDGEAMIERKRGIHALDIGYEAKKTHLEKSRSVLAPGAIIVCDICKTRLEEKETLVCPTTHCKMVAHTTCLAHVFLQQERACTALLPTTGSCPHCKMSIPWVQLVQELSLRVSGKREIATLYKVRKKRGAKASLDTEGESDSEADEDPLPELGESEDDLPGTASTHTRSRSETGICNGDGVYLREGWSDDLPMDVQESLRDVRPLTDVDDPGYTAPLGSVKSPTNHTVKPRARQKATTKPRNTATASTNEVYPIAQTKQAPKPRGRPRKIVVDQSGNDTPTAGKINGSTPRQPATKPRCRPKKASMDVVLHESENAEGAHPPSPSKKNVNTVAPAHSNRTPLAPKSSGNARTKPVAKATITSKKLVIEDSDWSDAEIVD